MRPGRLDRILFVGPPDLSGREEILAIRIRGMSVDPQINLREIAEAVRFLKNALLAKYLQCNVADGWLFWRRAYRSLSRSGASYDEKRYECPLRQYCSLVPCILA
jgi:SpoVK/Ycf46/Vps4 family AAA+-type ATPase